MNTIAARNENQRRYLELIERSPLTFGVGPAGTGKTFLAVAAAVRALRTGQCRRVIITRPVVEAGERLGFLPGDLTQKVDPYLRPLYDALYDLMGFDRVAKLFERGNIEIAPLAFMRGRTLNHAFIILDEAQNTTPEQMKMFLTRIGFGSKAVITGDTTQVDVGGGRSGLAGLERILDGIDGLSWVHLTSADVVRHRIVQDIVDAYERSDGHSTPDAG
jgi:phosphate starvation-inducible PhoH-like protein